MPLYTYQCKKCGEVQEKIYPITEFPQVVKCTQCGGEADKIIVSGHGGVQCDSIIDVPWLPSALKVLQANGEPMLETRGQYKQYLKDHDMVCKG